MTSYGELIDSDISLYTFFVQYFDNPKFTFLRETDDGSLVYGVKIRSQLSRFKRYLFAIVPRTKDYKKEIFLEELNWKIFQTRTLDEENVTRTHSYYMKDDTKNIISLMHRTNEKTFYSCSTFPGTQVVLLNGKTQAKPYSDRGTLGLALETYNCMVYV